MSRLTFVAVGAAVALMVASAAPAQATAPRTAPTVQKADGPAASVQKVGERNRWSNRRQDRDHFSFGFGFGAPLVYYPYPYRTYRTYECPYGYWYEPGYGCVTDRRSSYPRYYRYEPGVSLEFRF